MRLSKVNSYCVLGVDAQPITIEVHISNGLPGLAIVGLPEAAVRESKDRVRSAILNSQFEFPARRITVNLAPADIPKNGAGFDLPIAIGILHASDQIDCTSLDDQAFVGELSLSGQVRSVNGVLPMALAAVRLNRTFIAPAENQTELGVLADRTHRLAKTLVDVCGHLNGSQRLPEPEYSLQTDTEIYQCLSDVKGQPLAKRALEIAACGNHSLLMVGPPGSGKTMLAERLPSILPSTTEQQALEVASIYSVAGMARKNFREAPYRAPHHTASSAALVGGGSRPLPGEISLAHRGVLFLDELPEFPNKVLEVLRQPLESGEIWVSRAAMKSVFPAKFQLISAMNPCPCGYLGEPRCRCTPDKVRQYQGRISGPLLDRIDMQVKVSRPDPDLLFCSERGELSSKIKTRVNDARDIQSKRQGCTNSQLSSGAIDRLLEESRELKAVAQKGMEKMQLSARALHRSIRVAQSIADLEKTELQPHHLIEALSYRQNRDSN